MTSHQTVILGRGRHNSPDHGACVMELASMLAGEQFSDHPRAVCPVIGRYLRTLNDGLSDDARQDLYAVAALVVGTAAGGRCARRRRRALCRQRNLDLRLADGSRIDRLFTRLLRDDAGNACASAFLEHGTPRDAVAFVSELVAAAEGLASSEPCPPIPGRSTSSTTA